ncbi:tyrosine-type recombinase/integrase [Cryptosporangium phraense]|uniref:Tyrosine-type recombinase/integrase n=1 Tax=Cryptosporangium phraense TaxID=2593070 RepID=A0A545ASP0_9ACTN|nr:tyrosine-type recombinase/integrase [Cryptosporangium phraense]TQS44357.1 tyrosine-type recombinase/integrase [Cryptosporangium phraense]
MTDAFTTYKAELAKPGQKLGEATRRKYTQRVRAYLDWLETGDHDGDPLTDVHARDGAVRDYRVMLKTQHKLAESTLNGYLAALDDFYTRRGMGRADIRRGQITRRTAPKALERRDVLRYLRAIERCASARDRAIGLLPYRAGLRIGEVVRLDIDDITLSARTGSLRVTGKGGAGGKIRHVDIHSELRVTLRAWLDERPKWDGGTPTAALFVNGRHGTRLTDRTAREIVCGFGSDLDFAPFGPHVLRHTFGTELRRAGVDLATIAELMGHRSLETTRLYTLPSEEERRAAIERLTVDE